MNPISQQNKKSMQVAEVLISSKQALSANKLRTGLTMLGIVIGVSSVILISSIGQGATAFVTNELSVFGSGYFRIAPGQNAFTQVATTKNPLTTKDAAAINNAQIPNVDLVAPLAFSNATITGNQEKIRGTVRGVSPLVLQILQPEIVYGEFINQEHDDTSARVAVLGHEMSEELFGQDANPVGKGIRIDNARYRIIGMTKASGAITGNIFNNVVIVPINSLITNISGVDELFQIVVSVTNEDQLNQTITDTEVFLRDYRDIDEDEDADFFTQSYSETLDTIETVTNLLTLMISAISGISLVVGGVGIMNIMLVSVTERTREIGLLKAIGAKDSDVLNQFIIESITLSLIGGFIGILLGVAGTSLVSNLANIPFVINPTYLMFATIVSILIGLVFGIYPARRAAQLNPIDALRHE
ncbi:ABC transporter permease [Pseudomonadota bacterium]